MKKTIATFTALSLTISACSKTEKVITGNASPAVPSSQTVPGNDTSISTVSFDSLKAQWGSPLTNPQIFELIVNGFKSQHNNDITKWNLSVDAAQALRIRNQSKQNRLSKSNEMYLGTHRISAGDKYINSLAANSIIPMTDAGAFDNHFEIQMAAMAQSEALKRIFDVLNRQMEKDSQSISREIVADWSKNNPQAINEVNALVSLDVRNRAAVIQQLLQKYDRILAKYDFSDDGTKIIVYGLVAGALANAIKDTSAVQSLLKTVEEAKKVADKIASVRLAVAALNQYRIELHKNWSEVSDSFDAMKNDLEYYKSHGKFDIEQLKTSDKTDAELSRALGDVLDGKINDEAAPEKKGIFAQEHPLDVNVDKFLKSAAATADSFTHVIASVETIAKTLGVEISPDLQKALDTASQIAQGVQLGSTVIQAYASGGLVGAMGALSGGPAAAALGAGMAMQAQQQNEAYYKAIMVELGDIKKLQQETLKLQKDTMQMVRDLAAVVDEYHKEDLFMMQEVYHQVVTNTELSQRLLNQNLHTCQSILGYLLVDSKLSTGLGRAVQSVNSVEPMKQEIYSKIKNIKDLRRLLTGSAEASPDTCRQALTSAFSLDTDPNSPLFALYYVQDGQAEAQKEQVLYKGALKYLKTHMPQASVDDMTLHLPVASYAAIPMKDYYMKSATLQNDIPYAAAMEKLISPEALEANVTSLLTLHSLISVNESDWARPDDLKLSVWGDDSTDGIATRRSKMWLKNALRATKIAIAQDALLSGESLLSTLSKDWNTIANQASTCMESDDKNAQAFCFVRQNPVMMKNLVSYMLYQHLKEIGAADGRKIFDLSESEFEALLPGLLGVNADRIFVDGDKKYLALDNTKARTFRIAIPALEKIKKGYIAYSANMKSLLKMEKMISDELAQFDGQVSDTDSILKMYLSNEPVLL